MEPAEIRPGKSELTKSASEKSSTDGIKPMKGDVEPPQGLATPLLGQTTPQRQNLPTTTPPRPESKGSPFRTPTGKSRHSVSTIESLGLSPQDSVFWAKTPPSEALKKLERMNTGRSHEEGILSAETVSIRSKLFYISITCAIVLTLHIDTTVRDCVDRWKTV